MAYRRTRWVIMSLFCLLLSRAAFAQSSLILSEIMYAPVAPEPEWIEIYNTASNTVNLDKWQLSNIAKTAIFPSYILPSNSYLVVTKDSAVLRSQRPGNYPIVQFSLFALKNTGDYLVLKDPANNTIDSLYYLPTWGGKNGTSLERKSPENPATLASNWSSSHATSGATPGARNSVAIPNYDLALDSLTYTFTMDTMLVSFRIINRGFLPITSSRITVFRDSGMGFSGITQQSINSLGPDSTIFITLMLPHEPYRSCRYSIAAVNSLDTIQSDDTLSFTTQLGARPLTIVTNEIMFAPINPEPEWIEILNRSNDTLDLSGWQIDVAHYAAKTILSSVQRIPPDSMLIFTANGSTLTALRHLPIEKIAQIPMPSLSNSGSTIALHDLRGNLVDSASYDGSWISRDGTSLERIDPAEPGWLTTNWKACLDTSGCTVLGPNSTRIRDYDLALTGYIITDSSIVLTLANNGKDTIWHTAIIIKAGLDSITRTISTALPSHDSEQVVFALPVDFYGVMDCSAFIRDSLDTYYTNESIHFSLILPIPPDSLVINEIMFQPATGSCEWIEIYNSSSRNITMAGTKLATGQNSLRESFTAPPFFLPSESYGLLAANNTILMTYPSIAQRKEIAFLNHTSLGLSNDSCSIVLRNADSSTIDSIRYFKSWQVSPRSNLVGISLERKNWLDLSNSPNNWQACTDSAGATPLAANSAARNTAGPNNGPFYVSFDPNPFSPDGDGFQDESILNVQSGDEGIYALRARIYDGYGRIVRSLADATAITGSTMLAFDGKNNDGQLLAAGFYTALIELSSQDPPKLLKKAIGVVIAGRRR